MHVDVETLAQERGYRVVLFFKASAAIFDTELALSLSLE